MATLEDKILGEKAQNYCSSSESDGERDDDFEVPKEHKSGQSSAAAFSEEPSSGPAVPNQRPGTYNSQNVRICWSISRMNSSVSGTQLAYNVMLFND